MKFGEKLKELRVGKGMTQKELADAIDDVQSQIRRWEAGERSPTFGTVHRLCQALGVRCTVFENCEFEESKKKSAGRPKSK